MQPMPRASRWCSRSWASTQSWKYVLAERAPGRARRAMSMWWWDTGSRKCAITSARNSTTLSRNQPRGTGDAVRRVCESIPDFDGNLLILYGDTPLFRPASILGLLNRHRLKQAHLTLLTAVVDKPCPTGGSFATPAARSSTSSKTPKLGRGAGHSRNQRGRICGQREGDCRSAAELCRLRRSMATTGSRIACTS